MLHYFFKVKLISWILICWFNAGDDAVMMKKKREDTNKMMIDDGDDSKQFWSKSPVIHGFAVPFGSWVWNFTYLI